MHNDENWFSRNRENLIITAFLAVLVIVLALIVPGFTRVVLGTLKVLGTIALVVLGLVFLALPGIVAGFMPKAVDALDDALGDRRINPFLKFLFIAVMGVLTAILFMIVLSWMTYVPLYSAAYDMVGDVARLRELPQSAWGFLVYALVVYCIGWGVGASAGNGY